MSAPRRFDGLVGPALAHHLGLGLQFSAVLDRGLLAVDDAGPQVLLGLAALARARHQSAFLICSNLVLEAAKASSTKTARRAANFSAVVGSQGESFTPP